MAIEDLQVKLRKIVEFMSEVAQLPSFGPAGPANLRIVEQVQLPIDDLEVLSAGPQAHPFGHATEGTRAERCPEHGL